jgi:anti-sigma factor ChrR (cupin superfamily)
MKIDFDDLELPLAQLAAAGAETPRREVKDRLMARIRADEPAVPEGFTFNFEAQSDRWALHPVPGIRMKVLAMNRDSGYATLLLDVAPGTHFPPHHHQGAEECYVISGTLITCGRRLGPGDFVHADGGTEHGCCWSFLQRTTCFSSSGSCSFPSIRLTPARRVRSFQTPLTPVTSKYARQP